MDAVCARAAPDAPHWPGRKWFAALDAVAWSALWVAVVNHASALGGVVGAVLIGITAFVALRRLCTAVWNNHRYRFTTWRWGKGLATLSLIGVVLKLTMLE